MAKAKADPNHGPVYVPDRGPPYAKNMTSSFCRRRAVELAEQAGRETGPQRDHLLQLSLIYNGLCRLAGIR